MTQLPFHVYIYGPQGGPINSRFEDVADRLSQVDRLHIELDGSFVWVGTNWQLDGMIYDHDDCIRYVDLKGHCAVQQWRTLLQWLADPAETGQSSSFTIWAVHDRLLHDLQSFESIRWPENGIDLENAQSGD
jgi:hypothetical protein